MQSSRNAKNLLQNATKTSLVTPDKLLKILHKNGQLTGLRQTPSTNFYGTQLGIGSKFEFFKVQPSQSIKKASSDKKAPSDSYDDKAINNTIQKHRYKAS